MLYVIRHGETDWNLKDKIQGRADRADKKTDDPAQKT